MCFSVTHRGAAFPSPDLAHDIQRSAWNNVQEAFIILFCFTACLCNTALISPGHDRRVCMATRRHYTDIKLQFIPRESVVAVSLQQARGDGISHCQSIGRCLSPKPQQLIEVDTAVPRPGSSFYVRVTSVPVDLNDVGRVSWSHGACASTGMLCERAPQDARTTH